MALYELPLPSDRVVVGYENANGLVVGSNTAEADSR